MLHNFITMHGAKHIKYGLKLFTFSSIIERYGQLGSTSASYAGSPGFTKAGYPTCEFSDAFVKLRKVTASFVMSVRPSFRMEQLGYHWTYLHEILYLSIFRKSVKKIQVALKSYETNG
jgi:hypothetical protein